MPDGEHCPTCSKDVGYWPVALHVVWIRCPHCRARLTYAPTKDGSLLVTVAGAVCIVVVCIIPGVFMGLWMANRGNNIFSAIAGGFAVWVVLSLAAGYGLQMALTPKMRRTGTLIPWSKQPTQPEDSW